MSEEERAEGAEPRREALVVLLLERGSFFETYVRAIEEGMAEAGGRAEAVRIDTKAEPHAPERFGLTGAPGLVLFVNGKQVMAFAMPMIAAIGPVVGEIVRRLGSAVKGLLEPPEGEGR